MKRSRTGFKSLDDFLYPQKKKKVVSTTVKAVDQELMEQCNRVAKGSRDEIAWALYYLERKLERCRTLEIKP